MANTYTLIASVTVGATAQSSMEFTAIPATYTDLKVVFSTRNDDTSLGGNVLMGFNSSTSNFTNVFIQGDGSTVGSSAVPQMIADGSGGGSGGIFTNGEVYIPNYRSSNYKAFDSANVMENNATTAFTMWCSNLWSDTSAITSIQLTNRTSGMKFVQYSTAYLYGIKNS